MVFSSEVARKPRVDTVLYSNLLLAVHCHTLPDISESPSGVFPKKPTGEVYKYPSSWRLTTGKSPCQMLAKYLPSGEVSSSPNGNRVRRANSIHR